MTSYPPGSDDELIVRKDDITKTRFEFDAVFRPGSSQEAVFETVSPLITSLLDGYALRRALDARSTRGRRS